MPERAHGRSVGATNEDRSEERVMSASPTPARGSDRIPSLQHAHVEDVMRAGLVTCAPQTDLVSVARIMAANHIHAVVVTGVEPVRGGERLTWGLLTALDLVSSTLPGYEGADAGDLASTEIVAVETGEALDHAAQLMVEHQLTHLMVVAGGEPVGTLSTLDVAGCLAWGEG
jgi:CBS domain-containing protein